MKKSSKLVIALCVQGWHLMAVVSSSSGNMPLPFFRVLQVQSPPLSGRDVVILQNLLHRVPGQEHLQVSTNYDEETAASLKEFQSQMSLTQTGMLDDVTANAVLQHLMSDRYKDDGSIPSGYKYKIFVPVYKDRNIETVASLMDSKANVLYMFRVRAHGALNADGTPINQLTTNGNTVTGLMTSDLNSEEPDPKVFGPYPVIRCVKGLKGNAAIGVDTNTFISNYRSGILIHTGQWKDWTPDKNMPNSKGCMHIHPSDMKAVVDILTKTLGVKVNTNPFGTLPYPYEPQGIISIQQID